MSDYRYSGTRPGQDPKGEQVNHIPPNGSRVDGEYHYSYRYPNGAPKEPNDRREQDPVERIQRVVEDTADKVQRTAQQAAEHIRKTAQERDRARAAAPVHIHKASVPRNKLPSGKPMTVFGAIITAVFGTPFSYFLTRYTTLAFSGNFWNGFIGNVIGFGLLTVFGLVLFGAGVLRGRRRRVASMYLGLIGNRETVSLSALSSATGQSYRKVCKDLQDLLDRGVLPPGYLDMAGGGRDGWRTRPWPGRPRPRPLSPRMRTPSSGRSGRSTTRSPTPP